MYGVVAPRGGTNPERGRIGIAQDAVVSGKKHTVQLKEHTSIGNK